MSFATIEELIRFYQLEQHSEGGYYKETYRATGLIDQENLPNNIKGTRHYSTAIFFLIPADKKIYALMTFIRPCHSKCFHFFKGVQYISF